MKVLGIVALACLQAIRAQTEESVQTVAPGLNASSFPPNIAGSYSGIALGPDGKMYAAPFGAGLGVGVFDPAKNTSTTILESTATPGKYSGIALGYDLKLYCAPYNVTTVLQIDPKTNSVNLLTPSPALSGSQLYVGAIAVGTKVYFAPFYANSIMVYDVQSNTWSFISTNYPLNQGLFTGFAQEKYARNGNNRVFLAPYNADRIVVLDTVTQTVSNLTSNGTYWNDTSSAKFWGIVATTSGKIYTVPYNANYILCIDPLYNATSTSLNVTVYSSATADTTAKFRGGVAGVNGQVFFAPYNSKNVLILDTYSNDTALMDLSQYPGVSYANTYGQQWDGIAVSNNNFMVAAPFHHPHYLDIGSIRVDRFLPFAPLRITFTTDIGLPANVTATIPITFHKTPDCEAQGSRFTELTSVIWGGRPNETLVLPLDKMLTRQYEGLVPQEEEVFFCFHVIYKGRLEPAPELVSSSFWIAQMLPRSLILTGGMHCSAGNSQNGLYGGQNDGTSWRCYDGVLASELSYQDGALTWYVDNKPVTYSSQAKQFTVHSIFSDNDFGYLG